MNESEAEQVSRSSWNSDFPQTHGSHQNGSKQTNKTPANIRLPQPTSKQTKTHLACNKMTLSPAEHSSSRSCATSTNLPLVPEQDQSFLFNPIMWLLPDNFVGLTAHMMGNRWPNATLSTKGASVTLLMCLTQLVPNESQICRALDVLQPICALARRPFRPIYAFDQCVLCGSTSWAL